MDYFAVISTLVLGALAFYHYAYRNFDYFKKRGAPFIPPISWFGNLGMSVLGMKPFDKVVKEIYDYKLEAKYIGFFDFSNPIVMIRDPELIRMVKISNFDKFSDHLGLPEGSKDFFLTRNLLGIQGQRWKDSRALLSPIFTRSKMKITFNLVKERAQTFVDDLEKIIATDKTEVFDMIDIFGKFANDATVLSAYGIKVDSLKDPGNDFFVIGREATDFGGSLAFPLYLFNTFPRIARLFNVRLFSNRIDNFFRGIVRSVLAAKDTEGIVVSDMFQLLTQTNEKTKELNLTEDDMAAFAFEYYLGGVAASRYVASNVAHRIAVNPEVQEEIQREIDTVLDQCEGEITYDALHGMEYLDAVIKETLRLHPPVHVTDRICKQEFELPPAEPGFEPFKVEPGIQLWMPAGCIQSDVKYYSDPDKFEPERFSNANKNTVDPATFFPFGLGPRVCTGYVYALMQIKMILFQLMTNFKFSTCPRTKDPLKIFHSGILATVPDGVWLKIEPRTPQ